MTKRSTAGSIDEYVAGFPAATRRVLEEVRGIVRSAAPDATEKISYGVPTFHLNGNLVHFAAFERHIGFYPTPSAIEAFRDELAEYRSAKGSVQFPLDRPIPADLIRRIVEFRVEEKTRARPKKGRRA